ncbi:hypothetical protein FQN57_000320 [Myotisia sp. PD_48]|nr:hypothetical protein FQN57_000320 [Myotisia sp. PD_48]
MKKRKRPNKNRVFTQEEIWDDSALIQSWEEAAEEYKVHAMHGKLYHSIQAQGLNVEDVLREAEASSEINLQPTTGTGGKSHPVEDPALDLPDASVTIGENTDRNGAVSTLLPDPNQEESTAGTTHATSQPEDSGPSSTEFPAGKFVDMPQMLSGADASHPITSGIQDERLKSLMMSWYFAGYYTGLYEGQQQAAAKK